jgi:hypothetical protein
MTLIYHEIFRARHWMRPGLFGCARQISSAHEFTRLLAFAAGDIHSPSPLSQENSFRSHEENPMEKLR